MLMFIKWDKYNQLHRFNIPVPGHYITLVWHGSWMAAAECVFVDLISGDKQHIDICVYGEITYCVI